MRSFPYPTVQTILDELKTEGCPISRPTFYNLETEYDENGNVTKQGLFSTRRSRGKWRMFTREEIDAIKKAIKANYGKSADSKRSLWSVIRGSEANGNR